VNLRDPKYSGLCHFVVNINSFNHKGSQSNTRSNAKETNYLIPFLTVVIVYISLIPFAPTSIQGKRLIKAYNTASRGCDVSNDKVHAL